jgi:hypothetical protein
MVSTNDPVLQAFIDVMGYDPPGHDPIAELMNLYAEDMQPYLQLGTNDALVRALSDVTGIPIPATNDPLLVFLTQGAFGDMKIRVRVDSQTRDLMLIYYDDAYENALSLDDDGNLVNDSDLDLSLDAAGYLREALDA